MRPGVPWSIKGIEPEAREAAKSQARRSGLTLGAWLNAKILEEAEEQNFEHRPGGQGAPHVPVDTLIERMAQHERQTAQAFDGINERLSGLNRRLAETVEKRIPRRPEDVPGMRAVETALKRAVEHIEACEQREQEALADLDQRLTTLSKRVHGTVEEIGAATRTQTRADEEMAALREEIGTLTGQIEAARADAASDRELAAVKATLAHISDRVDAMPDAAPIAEMDERLRALTERLEHTLAERDDTSALDALAERVQGLESRLDAMRAETAEEARRAAEEVARAVAERTARTVMAEYAEETAGGGAEELRALESGLDAVRKSAENTEQRTQETLEAVHDTLEKIVDRLTDLESRAQAEDNLPEMVRNLRLPPLGEQPGDEAVAEPAREARRETESAPPPPPAAEETPPAQAASAATAPLRAERPSGDDMHSVSRHDDFIAAARKAAQTTTQHPRRAGSRLNPFGRLRGVRGTREDGDGASAGGGKGPSGLGKTPLILGGAILLALATSAYVLFGPRIDLTRFAGTIFATKAPEAAEKADRASAARRAPKSDPLTTGSVGPQSAAESPGEPVMASRPTMGAEHPAQSVVESAKASRELAAETLPEALGPQGLRDAALAGDPAAQYLVATRYLEGKVVAQDFTAAVAWYRKAAEQGLAPAQYRLASMYEKGRGVSRDIAAATKWYERAAEQGNAMAMHNLAVLYAEAKPGDPKLARAAYWFGQAARLGLQDSQYNLGVLYERGMGVERDPSAAYHWFSIAARQGDSDAEAQAVALEGRIEAETLAELKAEIADWKPDTPKREANVVIAPVGTWAGMGEPTTDEPAQPLEGREAIAEAQALLNELGFSAGPPDGVMGDATANAVRLFQLKNGLEVNGTLTTTVLDRLRGISG